MMLEVPEQFASSVQSLLLYAGVPREDEIQGIESLKKAGGRVIFFLTSEEKKTYTLKDDEAGVTWDDDKILQKWLTENMHLWTGGQIGATNAERAGQFAALLGEVASLTNFDNTSMKYLTKNNEPLKNMYRNYRWVEDGVALRRAKGLGKGATAIIIAAGPSLDAQWDELARIKREVKNVTFIVCGRSYKLAMKKGITPDFVVEVEQFHWDDKIFMFAPEPNENTVLCGPLTSCPGLFSAWPALKMILLDHNVAKLFGMEIGTDSIDGGNSIVHHMWNLAMHLGCEEVVLAGVDLSYPPGCKDTHAVGTFHPWDRIVSVMEHNRQEPKEVDSTDGGKVMASPAYKNFCLFLEMQIATHKKEKPNLKVWNLSPHGQKIHGTEFKDITQWLTPSSPAPSSSERLSSLGRYSSPAVSDSTSSSSESTDTASS